jgi:hypothetical protein
MHEVNYLFDFLFDLTKDPVFYALYITIILGLTIRIAWVWAIEYNMTDASSDMKETKKLFIHNINHSIGLYHDNDVFEWLVNTTKRVECFNDDGDAHHSFSVR